MSRTALSLALALAAPAFGQVVIQDVAFIDRAATGQASLGNHRGSLGIIDFDADGWMDVVIAEPATKIHRLYRNIPHATIPGARAFQDVSAGSGLDDADGKARGAGAIAIADYDNDGHRDIFIEGILNADGSYGLLYRSNGDGTFANVSIASGVRTAGSIPESASWIDYDLDGWVDLFIANIGASPSRFRLLRNNRDGTFDDASSALPALPPVSHQYSHTWCDIDGDAWPECILINTGPAPALLRSQPDGQGGRIFSDIAASVGYTKLGPAPMGIAAGDYDNDGDFDFAITDAATGTYYRNDAGSLTPQPGLMTSIFGWGTTWLDAEGDGDLDHYQAGSFGSANVDRLFLNASGTFTDISAALNTTSLASQHLVQVDYDNDLRPDVITINPGSPGNFISIYENISTAANPAITIRLVGTGAVNHDAIGSIVRITAAGKAQVRQIASGSSTAASEDLRANFGLGAATAIDSVEVIWARAGSLAHRTDTYAGPIAPGQVLTLSPHCLADCEEDGDLDIFDFLCFQSAHAGQAPYADIEEDGDWDIFDFLAFQGLFFGPCT